MSAGEQDPERRGREASHGGSVAQKLLCGIALACAGACDDGPGAPPIDPDDVDGDGIPNAQDVCPGVHDPEQHDEDGDGFGDRCDVCPTVVDPLQLDRGELDTTIAFNDGVGDACDPRPTRGGDKLGALHTFAADTTPSWLGAGWTIADDRAHATGAARWQHARAEPGDAVTARLAIESLAWTSTGGSIAVAVDGDGIESARGCTLFQDRDADGHDELEARELGGAVDVRAVTGTVTGRVELVVSRAVDRHRGTGGILCALRSLDERGFLEREVTLAIDLPDATTTGQYVFAAEGADAVVTSLVVYKSPIACPSLSAAACPRPEGPAGAARGPDPARSTMGPGAKHPGDRGSLGFAGSDW